MVMLKKLKFSYNLKKKKINKVLPQAVLIKKKNIGIITNISFMENGVNQKKDMDTTSIMITNQKLIQMKKINSKNTKKKKSFYC